METSTFMESNYDSVMRANVKVHSKIAKDYSKTEPHYKPENLAKVKSQIERLIAATHAKKVLDLGCGTGFMIDLMKNSVDVIHGVDITQEMLNQINKDGKAKIELFNSDTAKVNVEAGAYDLVTSYSFLHHLFDLRPTLQTAFKALRSGGKYYADLDPNFYFWKNLSEIQDGQKVSDLVQLERAKATEKDHEVAVDLGVQKEELDQAEFGKNILGGFQEEKIVATLKEIGFKEVEFFYHWFIGEADVIYSKKVSKEQGLANASLVHESLTRALPLSRPMFKYVGFVATR